VQVNLDPENDVENACPKLDLHGFKTGAVHIETVGKTPITETKMKHETSADQRAFRDVTSCSQGSDLGQRAAETA